MSEKEKCATFDVQKPVAEWAAVKAVAEEKDIHAQARAVQRHLDNLEYTLQTMGNLSWLIRGHLHTALPPTEEQFAELQVMGRMLEKEAKTLTVIEAAALKSLEIHLPRREELGVLEAKPTADPS